MSYQNDRDRFISWAGAQGFHLESQTLKLLRYASTLQRLAVAQCNGDYPADNGERKVVACGRCEGLWVRSSMRNDLTKPFVDGRAQLVCRDCRTVELAEKVLVGMPWIAEAQGDPRGYVLSLYPKDSTREDRDSGRATRVCVPGRE